MNFSVDVSRLVRAVDRLTGERNAARRALHSARQELRALQQEQGHVQTAQAVIQQVARATQEQLEYRVSELASMALETVFDDPYKVALSFEEARGRTAASVVFERDGVKIDPMSCSGGGAVDVAALALQITLWALSHPRSRAVLVLDEPLRFLKGRNMPARGAALIKDLSQRLGVQVIMVSHDPEMIEEADKVFDLASTGGKL